MSLSSQPWTQATRSSRSLTGLSPGAPHFVGLLAAEGHLGCLQFGALGRLGGCLCCAGAGPRLCCRGRGGGGQSPSSLSCLPLASLSFDWMLRYFLSLSPWYSKSHQRAMSGRARLACFEHLPKPAGGCRWAGYVWLTNHTGRGWGGGGGLFI